MTWFRLSGRRRRRGDERGAAAVEFAIIFPVLATLLMGIIEYGYFFYVAQSASSAAREVARQLSVGNCTTYSDAYAYANSQANLTSLTLKWGPVGGPYDNTVPAVGDALEVQVGADAAILNFIPIPNGGAVTRSVQVYVEDKAAGTCP